MIAPRVVVAHEAEVIREAALRVVRRAGYAGIGVTEGESTRVLLDWPPHPEALIVDVGLPGALGYELCDEIRRRSLPTKVILIASVYSRTAYKRRPSSLYGADDYIEQHHIPDALARKLARFVAPPRPLGPDPAGDLNEEEQATIRDAAEHRLAAPGEGESLREHARRLARLLMADIVLYNGSVVEQALRDGDLEERLAADLKAGRELFAGRAPAGTPEDEDYIGDALNEFVLSRRETP